jgi:hypothetical protein
VEIIVARINNIMHFPFFRNHRPSGDDVPRTMHRLSGQWGSTSANAVHLFDALTTQSPSCPIPRGLQEMGVDRNLLTCRPLKKACPLPQFSQCALTSSRTNAAAGVLARVRAVDAREARRWDGWRRR